MSVAYLLLAHHQPVLLARLVDRLVDRDAHVFLHVDRRVEIGPFREALAATGNPLFATHLHLVVPRRKVAYFGFSTVEATLDLMRHATAFGRFRYLSLHSGTDYPIKPREEIAAFFADATREFIVFWLLRDRPSWLHKIEHYFLTDLIPIRNLRKPRLRNVWQVKRTLPYLYWRNFHRFRARIPKRSYPFADLPPYGGSQWWTLSDACVRYILDFVTSKPEVVRFFRYAECPDELFFQTIVMNSPFAERAANYEAYWEWSRNADPEAKTDATRLPESSFNYRYIDWSGPYGGPRGYPAILDERDFEALRSSDALFARKFDVVRSAGLLERIDAELLVPGIAGGREC